MEGISKNAELNRDKALDAVKGFAILLVMLGHCIGLNGLADAYLYDAIAAVQMPLFMAVSGYLAGLRVNPPCSKPDLKKQAVKFGKRSIAYLVPFFTWMVIVSFPHCLTELKTELFHLDYGLWFLATLWIITLVTSAAAYIADLAAYGVYAKNAEEKKKAETVRFFVYCGIVFICYFGFFLQGRSGNTFLSPSLTVRYMPFYVTACLISYYAVPFFKGAKNKKAAGSLLTILCMIGAAVFVILICAYDMIVVTDTKTLVIQMAASFLGTYACFYAVAHIPKGWLQNALAYIGQFTLEIYVLHFRFARLLRLEDKNLIPFHWDTILWIFAAFVLMSALTALTIWILKRFWTTDLLCFGKIRPRTRKQTSKEEETNRQTSSDNHIE